MPLYGGIEAGGTKFVCAIGNGPENIHAEIRFPTTKPDETLAKAGQFFREYMHENQVTLSGIGIGSFGPLDLNPKSSDFGKITSTPKPGWAFTDIRGVIESQTFVPVAIDTDVNAAGLAEGRWGAAQGLEDFIYLTIGTGIGGGLIVAGKPYHGLVHPEMGHIPLPHDMTKDPYTGHCPFHKDCFEGLACGPALEARWGQPAHTLPPDHPAWELEAHYIALGLASLICVTMPQRIILGGGVMEQRQLFPMIHRNVQAHLNGYIYSDVILKDIQAYIVPPALGGRAGVLGSIALAMYTFPEK
jgi:fructokinase